MVARERHESAGIMETEDVHPSKRFLMQIGTIAGGGGTTDVGPTAVAKSRQQEQQRRAVTMAEAWRNHQYSSAASRICRVTRASGGKDRHSKVLTTKGLRDRRVRLSVPTAIQFYDLQDRLGYDQPSKAVEWLIKAAAAAIADLPSLDAAFPSGEKPPPGTEDAKEGRQHEQPLTKSACSSTSETSKGSVLSIARSEIRVKARERARERRATAKEKEKDRDDDGAQFAPVVHQQSLNLQPSSSHSSFIDLLTGGNHQNQNHNHAAAVVKAELFGQVGLFSEGGKPHHPPGFPTETHFNIAAAAALATGDHPETLQPQHQQQFAFMPEHLIPLAATAAGGDYINFSICPSGVTGFNRGTLQSNFTSLQPNNHHLQRLSSSLDGSNLPFFIGPASQPASAAWQGTLPGGFDGRLRLCYDGHRHSDLKGKGRN